VNVDAPLVGPTFRLPALPTAMGIFVLGVGVTTLYYWASQ